MFTHLDYLVQVERTKDAIAYAERQRQLEEGKAPSPKALSFLRTSISRIVDSLSGRMGSGGLGQPKPGPA